jgi:short-subunit dehydrogenase
MSKGTALITGASSGIGAALARQFASKEYDLIISARRAEKLEEVASGISGVNVKIVTADLGSNEGADSLAAEIKELGINVDILVNNAGVAYSGKFDRMTRDEADNLITLNMTSLVRLTQNFLPGMIQRGYGRILNVASVASFQPVPSMTLYAASKAFVLSLTEGMSEELRGTGVTTTALCPGLTQTEMVDALEASDIPAFMMSSADEVAREGYDALMAREAVRIPGIANQAAVTWAKHQPRWLVRGLGGLWSRLNPTNQ